MSLISGVNSNLVFADLSVYSRVGYRNNRYLRDKSTNFCMRTPFYTLFKFIRGSIRIILFFS